MAPEDDEIYRAPSSDLDEAVQGQPHHGSLDRALVGDFDFNIIDVLKEGWALVAGSKGAIWAGVLCVGAASYAGTLLTGDVVADSFEPGQFAAGYAISLLAGILVTPITAGVALFAIKRAAGDQTASIGDVFGCFQHFPALVGVAVLTTLFVILGLVCFVLPGIYLTIVYMMAPALVVERGMGVWEAMETSRKSIGHCWFRIIGMSAMLSLIAALGGIVTLGIGMIWIVPMAYMCIGAVYCRVFGYGGVEDPALAG